MIKDVISKQDVCDLLNEMLKLDYDCVYKLVTNRIKCNDSITNHPTIQVGINKEDNSNIVGIMGILNGFFGINDDGSGAICYLIDDKSGKIIKFEIIDTCGVNE